MDQVPHIAVTTPSQVALFAHRDFEENVHCSSIGSKKIKIQSLTSYCGCTPGDE
jgi:hypothetical protein